MTPNSPTPDLPTPEQLARAGELIALQYDNELELEQAHELDQLVCKYQEIRHRYIRAMSLHADLRQQAALLYPQESRKTALEPSEDATPRSVDLNESLVLPAVVVEADDTELESDQTAPVYPKLSPPEKKRWNWRLAAAILLPLFAVGTILLIYARRQPTDRCTLEAAVDARWADADDATMAPGSPLKDGVHILTAGTIKLSIGKPNLEGSAAIAIEAPSRFEILPGSKLNLSNGKLCARVVHGGPGLTVTTPDLTAVDLGTEFAVDVTIGKATHLEVMEGQVRAQPSVAATTQPAMTLSAGEAVQAVAGSATLQKDVARPLAFVRPSQVQAVDVTPLERWGRFSQTIRKDPDLVGYYPFDDASIKGGRLINQAQATGSSHDGSLGAEGMTGSSPRWGAGRWAGKPALEFGGPSSTAVTIPAGLELISDKQITICAWLKRSEITKPCHLLSGEDENSRAFNVGFIRMPGGRGSGLSDCVNFTWSQLNVMSATGTSQTDRWTFISLTSTLAGTRFYEDGNLLSANATPGQQPVLVKTLVLGAPAPKSQLSFPSEYFNGSIDELMIYKRALSAEEIAHLYRLGNPY